MRSRWTTPSESAESVNSAARHIVDRRASLRRELDGLFAGCEVSALKVFASTQAPNATHYELTDLAEGGKPMRLEWLNFGIADESRAFGSQFLKSDYTC